MRPKIEKKYNPETQLSKDHTMRLKGEKRISREVETTNGFIKMALLDFGLGD